MSMHKDGTCKGCVKDPHVRMEHQLKDEVFRMRAEADEIVSSLDNLWNYPHEVVKRKLEILHKKQFAKAKK
jgi:hypothetical protein